MKRYLLIIALLFGSIVYAVDAVEFLHGGPIHEAFIVQESDAVILQAIAVKPPADLTEKIPDKTLPQAQWIHGYWAWSQERGDFIWVSGVWRRSPVGQVWISGKWHLFEEGWVWLKGFWSPVSEEKLTYLTQTPPDAIDEMTPLAPGSSYFWVPGSWVFSPTRGDYVWYRGRWASFNEQWVYMPAHYEWREQGYIFVPGFWDWVLEDRGAAYANAYVPPPQRSSVVYQPSVILDPLYLVETLYPCWPDYICFFHHHYFYHFEAWAAWGAAPPWWRWDKWWTFTPCDSWWLWWWWTHAGYPQPPFITALLVTKIPAPSEFVVKLMQMLAAPVTVAPNGVIGNAAFIQAITKVTGHAAPIVPINVKQLSQIQGEANDRALPNTTLLPSAATVVKEGPSKPFFGPTTAELASPPEYTTVPALPNDTRPQDTPPVLIKQTPRPPTYRTPPPSYQPPSY